MGRRGVGRPPAGVSHACRRDRPRWSGDDEVATCTAIRLTREQPRTAVDLYAAHPTRQRLAHVKLPVGLVQRRSGDDDDAVVDQAGPSWCDEHHFSNSHTAARVVMERSVQMTTACGAWKSASHDQLFCLVARPGATGQQQAHHDEYEEAAAHNAGLALPATATRIGSVSGPCL